MSDSQSTSMSTALEPAAARDSMWALVVEGDAWDRERGFRKTRVPRPSLNESSTPQDATHVIVQVLYAGVCGTDRGLYERKSLKSTILRSLGHVGALEFVIIFI